MNKLLILALLVVSSSCWSATWECNGDLCRYRVFNGWIVKECTYQKCPITYVDDKFHRWQLEGAK